MDSPRDEARLLAEVMAHAGIHYRLGWMGDAPLVSFRGASPACEEGCEFFVDMPGGWLRVTTTLPLVEASLPPGRNRLKLSRFSRPGQVAVASLSVRHRSSHSPRIASGRGLVGVHAIARTNRARAGRRMRYRYYGSEPRLWLRLGVSLAYNAVVQRAVSRCSTQGGPVARAWLGRVGRSHDCIKMCGTFLE